MARRSSSARPTTRAVEALVAALDAGRWPAMGRLPGEVHLATELGVARGTIRRALVQLAAQGRLICKPHAGFLVAPGTSGAGVLAGTLVLVGHGGFDFPFAEEYPAAVALGVQQAARAAGLHVMVIAPERWEPTTQEGLAARRPAAVVVADIVGSDRSLLVAARDRLAPAGVPLVWHADPDDAPEVDAAAIDQAAGARLLLAVCRDRRRQQALILDTVTTPQPWWNRRRDALLAAAAESGVAVRRLAVDIEPRNHHPDDGNFRRRTRIYAGHLAEVLATGQRPDAVLAVSDSDVAPATAACRLVGLDPSTAVDVLGFDGYWARTWERDREPLPPLATIRADHTAVGRRLVDLALREDRTTVPRRGERVAVELVLRE